MYSHPSSALPFRSTCPIAHMSTPHFPSVHLGNAPNRSQTFPQTPQFLGSFIVSAHAPPEPPLPLVDAAELATEPLTVMRSLPPVPPAPLEATVTGALASG